jgi:hypothetical protein
MEPHTGFNYMAVRADLLQLMQMITPFVHQVGGGKLKGEELAGGDVYRQLRYLDQGIREPDGPSGCPESAPDRWEATIWWASAVTERVKANPLATHLAGMIANISLAMRASIAMEGGAEPGGDGPADLVQLVCNAVRAAELAVDAFDANCQSEIARLQPHRKKRTTKKNRTRKKTMTKKNRTRKKTMTKKKEDAIALIRARIKERQDLTSTRAALADMIGRIEKQNPWPIPDGKQRAA